MFDVEGNMKHMRIVCGYCSVDADHLPDYYGKHYGNPVVSHMHLMKVLGLTLQDFQENTRREPPAGQETDSEVFGVYAWFLARYNTRSMWSEKV